MGVDALVWNLRIVTKNVAIYNSQCQKQKTGSKHFWILIQLELICVRELSRNYKEIVDSHQRMQIIPPYKNQEGFFPFPVTLNTKYPQDL